MTLLIADDHGVVRGGLRLLLDRQPDMTVVAEAGDGAEAVAAALAHRPDVCVLDVSMPKLTGLQATREIKAQAPEIDVLILSMHDDERYLFEALKAGRRRLRPQDGGRPGPRRRRPRRPPRRAVPDQRRAAPRWSASGWPTRIRARRAADPARAGGPQADRRGAHQQARSPRSCTSPRRPSSRTAATCCASSACATASSSCATRSAAASSRPDP